MKLPGSRRVHPGAPRPRRPGAAATALLCWLFALSGEAGAQADADADAGAAGLGDLSIEQLMNETVTSVSKKAQSLIDAAAAIATLSNEDLRNSGATSVTEALRLVPGVDVGAVNASQWAVSARGFNSLYANKLLVLIDGRAVYTPLFAGVYWDLQQPRLEDLDRIEVIRGPGGTLWGANAVNGVINVVTRSARETEGAIVSGGGGDPHQVLAGARYGGHLGQDTWYRVYAGYQKSSDFPLASGDGAGDGWAGARTGFRFDAYPQNGRHMTWQANAARVETDNDSTAAYNISTLGRWTQEWSDRSSMELQGYYDRTYRNEASRAASTVDTFDLTLQNIAGLGERNDLIWGLGYRFIGVAGATTNSVAQVTDNEFAMQLFSGFVQDEFKLLPQRLSLTAGLKLERNDFTGLELQPSVRALFKPEESESLWAAISRAVRTPDVVEGRDAVAVSSGEPFTGPGGGQYVPTLVGNRQLKSEVLWAYELGYRILLSQGVSVDLAAFYNDYRRLIGVGSIERFIAGNPGQAEIPWANNVDGESHGGELAVTARPARAWRLTAAYSLLLAYLHGGADAVPTQHGSPRHKASLRSSWDFSEISSLDTQLRYVGPILGVASYFTADLRWSYRPRENLEFSLVGQNLLQPSHAEQGPALLTVNSEVPRGVYAKLGCRF